VALACAGGLAPVRAGGTAGQEWLPRGDGTAFVATVGCAGQDGPFGDFVAALAEPDFGGPGRVAWTARDGRRLILAGGECFTIDGAAAGLGPDGRPEARVHLDNPACTMLAGDELLRASYGGHQLVLDIAGARRIAAEPLAAGARHAP
jgi:hypothetical protein